MTSNIVIVSTNSITMQQFEEQDTNNMGQLMHIDDIKIEDVPIGGSPDTINQMSLEERWLLAPKEIEVQMQMRVILGQVEECPFCGFKGQKNRVITRQQKKMKERHERCLQIKQ